MPSLQSIRQFKKYFCLQTAIWLVPASLVAQLVKNLTAMQETPVWEDALEKGRATHSSILAWRISWRGVFSPWGHKESDMTERLPFSLFSLPCVSLSVCVLSYSVMSHSLRPHDCSPPGSSVHGMLQARIMEWVAISSSRDLPDRLYWQVDSLPVSHPGTLYTQCI